MEGSLTVDEREKFEGMMGGAFSHMESIQGPEMFQLQLEQQKNLDAMQKKSLTQMDEAHAGNMAHNEAIKSLNSAQAAFWSSMAFVALLLGIGGFVFLIALAIGQFIG